MEVDGSVACQILREQTRVDPPPTETEPKDDEGVDSRDESEKCDDRTGDEDSQDGQRYGEKRDSDDQCLWSKSKKRRKQSNPIRYQSPLPLNLATGRLSDDKMPKLEICEPTAVNFACDNNSKIKCPHCADTFANEESIREHVEVEHVQKLLEKQIQQQQHQQFSSKSSLDLMNSPPPILEKIKDSNESAADETTSETKKAADGANLPTSSAYAGMSITSQAAAFAAAMSSSVTTPSSLGYPPIPGLMPPMRNGAIDMQQPINLSMSMGAFPGHVPPYLIPLFPQGHSPPITTCQPSSSCASTSLTASGMRIFNPEAYCELCHKEFCNKYFLKTHKANKHGIYSMDSFVNLPYGNALFAASLAANSIPPQLRPMLGASPPAADPSMLRPSGFINMESYCEICQKEFCNKYFLKKHKLKIHGIFGGGTPANGSNVSSVASGSGGAVSPPDDKPTTTTTTSVKTDVSLVSSGVDIPLVSSGVAIPLTYSGVAIPLTSGVDVPLTSSGVDVPLTSSSVAVPLVPSGVDVQLVSSGLDVPLTASGVDVPLISSSIAVPLVSSGVAVPLVSSGVDVPLVPSTVDKLAKSSPSLEQSQTNSPEENKEQEQGLPGPIAPIRSTTPLAQLQSSISVNTTGSESKPMAVFTPEKMREIGVINADAFCALCCKEFCNKYFLRTHRQNKHGFPPSSEASPGSVGSNASKSSNNQVSTAATAAAIAAAINNNSSEAGLKRQFPVSISPPTLTLAADATKIKDEVTNESKDLSCHMCSRPFASPYLLKMHLFYTHNFPSQKDDVSNSESPKSGSPSKSIASNVDEGKPSLEMDQQVEDASQDLHRLQSLIQELNGPTHNNEYKVRCHMCFQEMENKYFLRAHMMTEHGTLLSEENVGAFVGIGVDRPAKLASPPNENPAPSLNSSANEAEVKCDICIKDFCNRFFLKQHKMQVHGLRDSVEVPGDNVKFEGMEARPDLDPKLVMSGGDASARQQQNSQNSGGPNRRNYCEICNKELCNKYFMKTHMLKMHGIAVNERSMTANGLEGAGRSSIGGVTCDICQKELCSKYFLKVHKQNTHGVSEDGVPMTPSKEFTTTPPTMTQPSTSPPGNFPSSGMDSGRYFSNYSEICPLCDRRFKSIKWLKTHMASDHQDLLKENMFLSNFVNMPTTLDPQAMDMAARSAANVAALFHSPLMNGGNHGMIDNQEMISKVMAEQKILFPSPMDCNMEGSPERSPTEPTSPSSENEQPPQEDGFQKQAISGNGTRIYRCSYCVYSTRWLSNLYAHEKRHTGGVIADSDHKFVCRICHRAYRYNHSLQRHVLSHRIFGGLTNSESSEAQENANEEDKEQPDDGQKAKLKKYRCSRCSMKFHSRELCVIHIRTFHGNKAKETASGDGGGEEPDEEDVHIYNCRKCNFSTKNFLLLNQHIKQEHNKKIPSNDNSDNEAMSPTNQMPMTYAMPQNMPASGPFIMQPFLIAQPESGECPKDNDDVKTKQDTADTEEECIKISKPFVPSLVYLPVSQKISKPLTVAFTLTPA